MEEECGPGCQNRGAETPSRREPAIYARGRVGKTKDKKEAALSDPANPVTLDHSSNEPFTAYYAEKSGSPEQLRHFRSVRDAILRVLDRRNGAGRKYDVVDIGCNAGGQCGVWAESGHRVHGLDINEPLLDLARKRAAESGQEID